MEAGYFCPACTRNGMRRARPLSHGRPGGHATGFIARVAPAWPAVHFARMEAACLGRASQARGEQP